MSKPSVPYPLYNLYVEGDLGMHKGKPVLKQAFYTREEAEKEMLKLLVSGRCAFVSDPQPKESSYDR